MRILKYRMYGAGLSNQRMSLDMGVALSVYTQRAFTPYEFKSMEHSGRALRGQIDRYNISDLFEIPVPVLDEAASSIPWSGLSHAEFAPERLGSHVFVDDTFQHDHRVDEFRGRRDLTVTDLNVLHGGECILDLASRRNFCNVTPLFYLKEEARSSIMNAVRRVIPKALYRQVALKIAERIGVFNAYMCGRVIF